MIKIHQFLFCISVIIFFSCEKKIQNIPEYLYINSQENIDKYAHLFENAKSFEGEIVFNNSLTYDLSCMRNITEIFPFLHVKSQAQLDAFESLKIVGGLSLNDQNEYTVNNIEEINGLFLVSNVRIVNAPSLKRVDQFYTNTHLEVLGDFSNIETIGKFWMQYPTVLNKIEDFSKLRSVGDFRLDLGKINILKNAFSSLRNVDIFYLTYFEEEKFDLEWVSGIEDFKDFGLAGSFEKQEICQYIFPIRNNASNEFYVSPSLELKDSLGLNIYDSLDPLAVEKLCE
ncbi:MAG: hypothetical protein ACI9P5_002912 [Saprospiraceae bacterium]|jgi:hypothetical protein